jgi:hypothetical protein
MTYVVPGIYLPGSCSYLEILDNYIHDIVFGAITGEYNSTTYSNIILRGNEISMTGCPSGVSGQCIGSMAIAITSSIGHHLIEYNQIHRAGDFIDIEAPYSIIRNNYLHDYRNSYFPDGVGDGNHVDMFQPMGASYDHYSRYHVYESNFMGDNIERNSHILQMRTDDSSEHHVIFRGNVGYNHGSYAMQCGGADNVYFYNNTLYRMNYPGGIGNATSYNAESGEYALNNYNFNNIYSETGKSPIAVQTGNSCTSSNNLCYSLTAGHASCVSFSNPLFSDTGSHDYHLQSGSPAIGQGQAVTTVTNSSGSGTSFYVADAGFFCDGYGIAEGDIIKLGLNAPVRITNINANTNTITVDRSITWNNGDGVYWRNQDAFPDIGAYEYRANGYGFAIGITGPTDQGSVSGFVPIAAGVTNAENVRFVIFYIDGIPAAKVTESPYSYTWDTANLGQGSRHLIEVRAYALLATPRMTESDQIVVVVGSPIDPQAPSGLYIIGKTSSSVSLGWPDSTGAFGYRVYRDGQKVGDTSDNRYMDTGLKPDTEYNYTVTALGSGVYESAQSSGVTVTTLRSGGGGSSGDSGGGGGGGCFISAVQDFSLWFMVLGLASGWLVWTSKRAKSKERRPEDISCKGR